MNIQFGYKVIHLSHTESFILPPVLIFTRMNIMFPNISASSLYICKGFLLMSRCPITKPSPPIPAWHLCNVFIPMYSYCAFNFYSTCKPLLPLHQALVVVHILALFLLRNQDERPWMTYFLLICQCSFWAWISPSRQSLMKTSAGCNIL